MLGGTNKYYCRKELHQNQNKDTNLAGSIYFSFMFIISKVRREDYSIEEKTILFLLRRGGGPGESEKGTQIRARATPEKRGEDEKKAQEAETKGHSMKRK